VRRCEVLWIRVSSASTLAHAGMPCLVDSAPQENGIRVEPLERMKTPTSMRSRGPKWFVICFSLLAPSCVSSHFRSPPRPVEMDPVLGPSHPVQEREPAISSESFTTDSIDSTGEGARGPRAPFADAPAARRARESLLLAYTDLRFRAALAQLELEVERRATEEQRKRELLTSLRSETLDDEGDGGPRYWILVPGHAAPPGRGPGGGPGYPGGVRTAVRTGPQSPTPASSRP